MNEIMNENEISEFKESIWDLLISIKNKHEDCKKVGNRDFIKELRESKDFKKSLKNLPFVEYGKFLGCIGYLLDIKNIYDRYSETHIGKILGNLCRELLSYEDIINLLGKLCSEPSQYKDNSNFDRLIENFHSLLEKPLNEYQVYSEIGNITVEYSEYKLIDSTIGILKKEPILNKDWKKEGEFKSLLEKPCIHTKVEAGDIDKAEEKALYNFKASFGCLNLSPLNLKPVLKGRIVIVHNETDNTSPKDSSDSDNSSDLAELNESDYNLFVEKRIKKLENHNTIMGEIKERLYWFGLGFEEKHPLVKLIKSVIVLEACLIKKNEEGIKCRVSKRGAWILHEKVGSERAEVENQLKEIYKIRSEALHKGNLIDKRINGKNPVFLAEFYSGIVLEELIDKCENYESVKQFIDEIDNEFKEAEGLTPKELCKQEGKRNNKSQESGELKSDNKK